MLTQVSGSRPAPYQALVLTFFLSVPSGVKAQVNEARPDAPTSESGTETGESLSFDTTTQECLNAHEQGQLLRASGKLLESRQALLSCSDEQCPAIVRDDCSEWFGEVRAVTPAVSISARLEGRDITQGTLFIDEHAVDHALSGKVFELNPGQHLLRLEVPGHPAQEQKILLNRGASTRHLIFDFTPEPPPPATAAPESNINRPPPKMSRPTPNLTYWLGGLTAASLISGVTFSAIGVAQNDRLQDSCAPYCSEEQKNSVDAKFLAADISWGLFAVAGVGTVLSYVYRPEVPQTGEGRDHQSMRLHSLGLHARLGERTQLSVTGSF